MSQDDHIATDPPPRTIVVSFGAPRSGTTYMRKLLETVIGEHLAVKLSEAAMLHPCKAPGGLIELANALHTKRTRLVFVRTQRHPLEICESFYALRTQPQAGGHAHRTDAQIVDAIETESTHTRMQATRFPYRGMSDRACEIVTARYEAMSDPPAQARFAWDVTRAFGDPEPVRARLLAELTRTFGDPDFSSHIGRLRHGIGRVMPEAKRKWFAHQLADVIATEGYERED